MKRVASQVLIAKATGAQNLAADPTKHVWVGANAGTGKTRVLSSRVVRLLLADGGLVPSEILALTYTRAGANEMADRLPKVVAGWDGLPEEKLVEALVKVGVEEVSPALLERARALPGLMRSHPVRVFTLHGFAQSILGRFSDEAGLPLGFGLLDDVEQKRALQGAVRDALLNADAGTDAALQELLEALGDNALHELTEALIGDWGRLVQLLGGEGGLAGALQRLHDQLALDVEAPMPTVDEAAPTLRMWLAALEGEAGKSSLKTAAAVREVLEGGGDLAGLFLKEDGQRYATKSLAVKGVLERLGAAWEEIATLQDVVFAARQREMALRVEAMTRSLLVWVAAVQEAYTAHKAKAGMADFNDLIAKLEALLAGEHGAAVLARLDQRIRHLLVDEGQDNSPAQHRIVVALANELLAGQGVGDGLRTVFAVGDVKQNIYRFQGADPRLFGDMHAQMVRVGGATSEAVHLGYSFRSSPAVLKAVDAVFGSPAMAKVVLGNEAVEDWDKHVSVFADAPGRVELWPLLEHMKAEKEEVEGWPVAAPQVASGNGAAGLAARLAEKFKAWVGSGEVLGCTGAPIGYGDMLVLTQTNATAAVIAAGLMRAGVPVALAGKESPSLLAEDLVAWLRAACNTHDRLALVQVLKSPLCGWRDAQIVALANVAGDGVWHDHVGAVDGDTAAWLTESFAYLRGHTVQGALVWMAAKGNLLAKYGRGDSQRLAAAEAALHGLLEMAARVTEPVELISLTEQAKPTPAALKAQGAVRVMTVHASKGLEAPIVVVAEVERAYAARAKQQKFVWGEDANGNPTVMAWRPADKDSPDCLQPLLDEELKRLRADSYRSLYVALTRASERLVMCGWQPGKGDVAKVDDDGLPTTWHGAVKETLATLEGWQAEGDGGLLIEGTSVTAEVAAKVITDDGDGWDAPLPTLAVRTTLQTPELWRGEVTHMLLETLPHVAAEARHDVGQRLVRDMAPAWSEDLAEEVLAEALRVMEELAWLFGPGSTAEVGVILATGVGRIDRLVKVPEAWWVLDFKTEASPPATVPADYRDQLAGYVHALQGVSGGIPVRAAVVWTRAAAMVEVDVLPAPR